MAKELSALRRLAVALEAEGADPAAQRVRANAVGRRAPRALTRAELERLLAMPDRRARRGRRDLAIMLLLGQAGLRRSEVCALRYEDLEELRRHPDPRRRAAVAPRVAAQSAWVVHLRHPKRGRARAVDLTAAAVEALRAWTQSRPEAASDHFFVSLARNRPPEPLVPRALNKLVGAYAERAGLPEDRRTPHVLRHTFCTLLADGGQGLEVIAELAGHADVRTTKGYVSVSSERRARAVRETFENYGPLGAARTQLTETVDRRPRPIGAEADLVSASRPARSTESSGLENPDAVALPREEAAEDRPAHVWRASHARSADDLA